MRIRANLIAIVFAFLLGFFYAFFDFSDFSAYAKRPPECYYHVEYCGSETVVYWDSSCNCYVIKTEVYFKAGIA